MAPFPAEPDHAAAVLHAAGAGAGRAQRAGLDAPQVRPAAAWVRSTPAEHAWPALQGPVWAAHHSPTCAASCQLPLTPADSCAATWSPTFTATPPCWPCRGTFLRPAQQSCSIRQVPAGTPRCCAWGGQPHFLPSASGCLAVAGCSAGSPMQHILWLWQCVHVCSAADPLLGQGASAGLCLAVCSQPGAFLCRSMRHALLVVCMRCRQGCARGVREVLSPADFTSLNPIATAGAVCLRQDA